jgi:hypothetical protein
MSDMMIFIGYINNVMIEILIYFTSHMRINGQIMESLLADFMYLYRTVMYASIELFALFLYIPLPWPLLCRILMT